VRAVLFDAVGTLIELREPVGETYARAAREAGVELSAARLQDAFAAAHRAMAPMVFPDAAPGGRPALERSWWRVLVNDTFAAAGAAELEALQSGFDRLFDHYGEADAWRTRSGSAALLESLRRRGLRTGIVSNFDHRLRLLLEPLGLAPLLDVVVLPADAGAAKPDARIFALALQRLGVSARRALYVGDDAHDDVAGARAAGLRALDVGEVPLSEILDWIDARGDESALD
jgi:putative hydrolase of the HAD superfamily